MTFSVVYQWVPGDTIGLQRFLIEHYLEHRLFTSTLLGQTPPVKTVEYPLQTMDSPREWLAAHQQVSQSVWTGIGGGESTDFETVNWDDPIQVADWQQLHAAWHESVRSSLNL